MVVSCHVGIQVTGGPTSGLSLNKSHWKNEILEKRKNAVFWVDGKLSVVLQVLWPAAAI